MSQSDEDAIRALEQSFNAAWDAHDPEALAEPLVDDAQFITVNGAWTTSREAFRDLMQRLHGASGPYRSSTRRTPEMHVRFLGPTSPSCIRASGSTAKPCTTRSANPRARAWACAWFTRSTGAGASSRPRTPTSAPAGGISCAP